jgi:hypothetical protein
LQFATSARVARCEAYGVPDDSVFGWPCFAVRNTAAKRAMAHFKVNANEERDRVAMGGFGRGLDNWLFEC